ncbi:MAG: hypothetical protein K2J20_01665, partial [Bacilli bacterium]|nr:hypothetical protein [Bacilli bacterium]
IKIEDNKGLCSGTSLFYEYLVEHNYLDLDNKVIYEFVELTRKYDTWEWKTKYNEEMSHALTLLFEAVGCDNYIRLMREKLEVQPTFSFNKLEMMLIENKKEQTNEKLLSYSKKIYEKEIKNLKAGIVFIDYEYRNDFAEYMRGQKTDLDFVMLVAMDYGTISYRSIKDGINVREIAEYFGGKGHDKAASSPIKPEILEQILDAIIGDK